jgi:hypothetical protein
MRNQRGQEIAALLATHTHTRSISPIGTTATVRTLNWKKMALGEKVLRRALNASGYKPSFALGHPTKANKFKALLISLS